MKNAKIMLLLGIVSTSIAQPIPSFEDITNSLKTFYQARGNGEKVGMGVAIGAGLLAIGAGIYKFVSSKNKKKDPKCKKAPNIKAEAFVEEEAPSAVDTNLTQTLSDVEEAAFTHHPISSVLIDEIGKNLFKKLNESQNQELNYLLDAGDTKYLIQFDIIAKDYVGMNVLNEFGKNFVGQKNETILKVGRDGFQNRFHKDLSEKAIKSLVEQSIDTIKIILL